MPVGEKQCTYYNLVESLKKQQGLCAGKEVLDSLPEKPERRGKSLVSFWKKIRSTELKGGDDESVLTFYAT